MMKLQITTLLLVLCTWVSAQSETEIKIQLMTPDLIGQVVLDQEELAEWIKEFAEVFEAEAQKIDDKHDLLCLVSIKHEGAIQFAMSSRPQIDEDKLTTIAKKLATLKTINTQFLGYSFLTMASINKGSKDEIEYSPEIISPMDLEIARYEELDLVSKKNHIMDYAANHLLPLLAHYQNIVDPQFDGVLEMGKLSKDKKSIGKNIEDITHKNFNYWRAIMEMEPSNQLISFTKVCLHLAKGEIARANRLLFLVHQFSDDESITEMVYEELQTKINLYNQELTHEIEKGIELHDEGKFSQALKIYDELLVDHSDSPWLNYEHYYSSVGLSKNLEANDKLWFESKKVIYTNDPMYPLDIRARNGKEAYLLFRRQEIGSLFTKSGAFKEDLLNYGDIALDLENYGFAAQIYWIILSHFKPDSYNDRNLIAHYLYCLDKLGETKLKDNFKGDFKKEFKKIEKEREKLMKENVMYQSFKD